MLRLAAALLSAAALLLVGFAVLRFDEIVALTAAERTEARAWEVLARAETAALTTHRIVTRLDYRAQERSILFGSADSLIIATVEFEYGLDLAGVGPETVVDDGAVLHVRLPEPRLLDIDIPLETITYFETSTGVVPLKDMVENRDRRAEMAAVLRRDAEELARARGLLPDEAAFRARMTQLLRALFAPWLAQGRTLDLRFGDEPRA